MLLLLLLLLGNSPVLRTDSTLQGKVLGDKTHLHPPFRNSSPSNTIKSAVDLMPALGVYVKDIPNYQIWIWIRKNILEREWLKKKENYNLP